MSLSVDNKNVDIRISTVEVDTATLQPQQKEKPAFRYVASNKASRNIDTLIARVENASNGFLRIAQVRALIKAWNPKRVTAAQRQRAMGVLTLALDDKRFTGKMARIHPAAALLVLGVKDEATRTSAVKALRISFDKGAGHCGMCEGLSREVAVWKIQHGDNAGRTIDEAYAIVPPKDAP